MTALLPRLQSTLDLPSTQHTLSSFVCAVRQERFTLAVASNDQKFSHFSKNWLVGEHFSDYMLHRDSILPCGTPQDSEIQYSVALLGIPHTQASGQQQLQVRTKSNIPQIGS